jgi:hypothetical protein
LPDFPSILTEFDPERKRRGATDGLPRIVRLDRGLQTPSFDSEVEKAYYVNLPENPITAKWTRRWFH